MEARENMATREFHLNGQAGKLRKEGRSCKAPLAAEYGWTNSKARMSYASETSGAQAPISSHPLELCQAKPKVPGAPHSRLTSGMDVINEELVGKYPCASVSSGTSKGLKGILTKEKVNRAL